MENQLDKKVKKVLKLDYEQDDGVWLRSGKSLRRLIGILGMSLPVILLLITLSSFELNRPLESISHYYYTRAGSVFTVILSLIAIFLLVYSGKKSVDFYISTFAGVFALFVVFFPTGNLSAECCVEGMEYSVTYFDGNSFREVFHLVAAALFLLLLAYMSFFIFTKSNKPPGERGSAKVKRNRIYRVCGVLIVVSLLVMLAGFKGLIHKDIYFGNNLTFWMETVAVESFGFAWLIKGDTFFTD